VDFVTPRVPWTPIDVMQLLFVWIAALFIGQTTYGIFAPPKVEGLHPVRHEDNQTLSVEFLPNNKYKSTAENGTFSFKGKFAPQDRNTIILSPYKSDKTHNVILKTTERDRLGIIIINIIFVQCSMVILIGILLFRYRINWNSAFGKLKDGPWVISLSCLIGLGFIIPAFGLNFISQIIVTALGGEVTTQEAVKMVSNSGSSTELILQALSVVILAPIAEELFFRGVVYTAIKQAGYPGLAVGFSAIFFASIHGSLTLILPLTLLAIVLIWIYEKTGSIFAPILVHATFNAVNFTMIKLLPEMMN